MYLYCACNRLKYSDGVLIFEDPPRYFYKIGKYEYKCYKCKSIVKIIKKEEKEDEE